MSNSGNSGSRHSSASADLPVSVPSSGLSKFRESLSLLNMQWHFFFFVESEVLVNQNVSLTGGQFPVTKLTTRRQVCAW